MVDRPDATRDLADDAGPASVTPETGAYREALATYADLIAGAEDNPEAMRRLERRIADHLVNGATSEPPSAAPEPSPVAET